MHRASFRLTSTANPIGARVRSSKPKESCLAATKSISRVIAGNRAAWRTCWTEEPRLRRRWRFAGELRSEEHTSELQSLMRISYADFCLKKKNENKTTQNTQVTIHTSRIH